MADDAHDPESKTEAPSARKLQHAYDEGQVPLSRDVGTAATMAAGLLALTLVSRPLLESLLGLIVAGVSAGRDSDFAPLLHKARGAAFAFLAVAGASAAAGAAAYVAQTRGGLWPEKALPDLSKVFELSGLKKLFSREVWEDLGLSLAKLVVVGAVLWPVVRDTFLSLDGMLLATPANAMTELFGRLASAGSRVLVVAVLIGGVDYVVNRARFMKRHRMTKEEAKREYKEDEGDPLIRSRRRRAHREFARGRASVEVPKADVVVVNPTHIAIALRYRRGEDAAPRVVAKGKGPLAERIRAIAREHGVPITQDIALARLLYRKVKVGRAVPAETYKAVAAVLAWVYRLTGRAHTRGGPT